MFGCILIKNFCQNCDLIIKKRKHQIDRKVLRQDRYFPTRLNFAIEKIRELFYSNANGKNETTRDMIVNLQRLKGKTKLKVEQNIGNCYDEIEYRRQSGSFQFEEDVLSKGAHGITMIMHELLLFMKFLQTKPEVKKKNIFIMVCNILL